MVYEKYDEVYSQVFRDIQLGDLNRVARLVSRGDVRADEELPLITVRERILIAGTVWRYSEKMCSYTISGWLALNSYRLGKWKELDERELVVATPLALRKTVEHLASLGVTAENAPAGIDLFDGRTLDGLGGLFVYTTHEYRLVEDDVEVAIRLLREETRTASLAVSALFDVLNKLVYNRETSLATAVNAMIPARDQVPPGTIQRLTEIPSRFLVEGMEHFKAGVRAEFGEMDNGIYGENDKGKD